MQSAPPAGGAPQTPNIRVKSDTPSRARRRRLRFALIVVVIGLAGMVLLAAPWIVGAYLDAKRGEDVAHDARQHADDGEVDVAREELLDALEHFRSARSKLASPFVKPAGYVPGIGRQLNTARAILRAADMVARSGVEAARAFDAPPAKGWIEDGKVDLAALRRVSSAMDAAAPLARAALEEIESTPRNGLIPPLPGARKRALEAIDDAAKSLSKAAAGVAGLPALLGSDEPRRYLLVFSNLAELRGTGGLYGFHAIVDASNGRISIGDAGRPREDLPSLETGKDAAPEWFRRTWEPQGALRRWQNVNLSPDFPTVGRIVADVTGTDGVIQLDTVGIASFLRLAEPIKLNTWPERITADNVAGIASNEVYLRYEDESRRDEFGQELLTSAFSSLLQADLDINDATLRVLGRAATGGHIQIFMKDPDVQRSVASLGLDGGLARARNTTDVLGTFNLNADGSKQDFYLSRTLGYTVRLDPVSNSAFGHVDVSLRDQMPAAGIPEHIKGAGLPNAQPNDNRAIVLFVRGESTTLTDLSWDGTTLAARRAEESGFSLHQAQVVVPSRRATSVRADFEVSDALRGTGRTRTYRLHIFRQPMLADSRYKVTLELPTGWEAESTVFSGRLREDVTLEVKIRQNFFSWLGHQVLRPIRAIA